MTNSLHHSNMLIYLTCPSHQQHTRCRMTISWIRRSYLRSCCCSDWAQRWLTYGSDWQVCVCRRDDGFRGHKGTHLDSSSPTTPSVAPSERLTPLPTPPLTPFQSVLPNITQTPNSIKDLVWMHRAGQTWPSLRWLAWSHRLGWVEP